MIVRIQCISQENKFVRLVLYNNIMLFLQDGELIIHVKFLPMRNVPIPESGGHHYHSWKISCVLDFNSWESKVYNQRLCLYSVVEVGLLPLNSTVSENETFPVCVELTAGSLERNVTVPLLVGDGSAMGESRSTARLNCNIVIPAFWSMHVL